MNALLLDVIRAARAEWMKLRRPGLLWGTLGAVVAVTALATAIGIATAGDGNARQAPGGPAIGVSVATLQSASGLSNGLSSAATLLGVVALCVCAGAVAGEYAQGTLRNLLIRQPRRLRLFAGIALACAAFSTLMVAVATLASVAASFVTAGVTGLDTSAWATGAAAGDVVRAAADTSMSTIGWAGIGFALAVVLRTPVAAIAVGVAYALPVESIVNAAVDDADRYLPGQLLAAVAGGGTTDVGYGYALTVLAAYAAVIAAGAAVLLRRRDVTA
ncbi:ABC transporter permease [Dactylosporangium vinaceum]|uniref:ABC transporter permease n=1 Tax=Dactylosporangium vinaceum TaxID=53362 RepID=A0ABV5MHG1_9ACTN|nr:ABC transporter permease subunit [Dactylosporangium vinaceum]UAB94773.1 ABC transporter permease [Dactylosporangium vinaceum]